MMQALAALALTLPPSAAFVVWAWLRLQRERDKKLVDEQAARLDEQAKLLDRNFERLEAQAALLARVGARLDETEIHIGQLTDRSMRSI
jgi:hypothetical protein